MCEICAIMWITENLLMVNTVGDKNSAHRNNIYIWMNICKHICSFMYINTMVLNVQLIWLSVNLITFLAFQCMFPFTRGVIQAIPLSLPRTSLHNILLQYISVNRWIQGNENRCQQQKYLAFVDWQFGLACTRQRKQFIGTALFKRVEWNWDC